MKFKKLFSTSLLGTALLFASCQSSSKLADSIEGSWSGAPEKLIDNNASSATITETYTFLRENTSNGGEVVVTALVSTTGAISGTEAIIQPFSVAAAATAQLSGTWEAKSNDEVSFTWNDSSLVVNIDPQAVTLSANTLNGAESPSVESLKPQMAESIKAQLSQALEVRFLSVKKFSDIKFGDRVLNLKVNGEEREFAKQGVNP